MDTPQPTRRCRKCGYPLDGLGAARCPECWQPFDPADASTYTEMAGDLVKVFATTSELEAHQVQGLLQSAGISAAVLGKEFQGGAAGGMMGGVLGSIEVWVGRKRQSDATEIIERFVLSRREAEARGPNADTWTCPECGESIEVQFTDCWSCGATQEESDA